MEGSIRSWMRAVKRGVQAARRQDQAVVLPSIEFFQTGWMTLQHILEHKMGKVVTEFGQAVWQELLPTTLPSGSGGQGPVLMLGVDHRASAGSFPVR